jgi:hypothetical protein
MRRQMRAFGHSQFVAHYLQRHGFGRAVSDRLRIVAPLSEPWADQRSEHAVVGMHQRHARNDEARAGNRQRRRRLGDQRSGMGSQ